MERVTLSASSRVCGSGNVTGSTLLTAVILIEIQGSRDEPL